VLGALRIMGAAAGAGAGASAREAGAACAARDRSVGSGAVADGGGSAAPADAWAVALSMVPAFSFAEALTRGDADAVGGLGDAAATGLSAVADAASVAGAGAVTAGIGEAGAVGAVAAGAGALAAAGSADFAACCSSGVPVSNCHQSRALKPITARLATARMFQKLSLAAGLVGSDAEGVFFKSFGSLALIECARGAIEIIAL
jgi:hypothetical protein